MSNLNVGEPRTVRLIYFLPNDRPYRAGVVQKMKDTIRTVQTFYAEQMEAHGYGKLTFRIETDDQGEPMVHRVDGDHPESYYSNDLGLVFDESERAFNLDVNIALIVIDNKSDTVLGYGGYGERLGKNSGYAAVPSGFSFGAAAHELGHAFGLEHDFRDGAYIMSYGPGQDRLSACSAEFLSVHPYFNPKIPIEDGPRPTVELISPRTYPPGSKSVPIQLQVNDSGGLHQVFLRGLGGLIACRGLGGKKNVLVEFNYKGVWTLDGLRLLPDAVAHIFSVEVSDTEGNLSYHMFFTLVESSPHHIGNLEGHGGWVHSVAFSSDGTLASGSGDGTVKLWDVATHQDIGTLHHGGWVRSVAFSSDGTLASGSEDGTVKLWDVATHQDIGTLHHGGWVRSVAFSSDGSTLASGSEDGTVTLRNVETHQDIGTLPHGVGVISVAFSSDGSTLASGSWDGTVKLWDVVTHQDIGTLPHGAGVSSVVFSSDGSTLASGSWDGTVKLWNVETKQSIVILRGHTSGVHSVAFSRDGRTLASGSADATVKLWDAAARVNFAVFGHTSGVNSVAFSPDGRILASGGYTVELWDTSGLMGDRLEVLTEVDLPDPNLHVAIAEAFGLPPNTPILRGHLTGLTRLEARNANINNLTGLESATNLRSLDLGGNSVSNISAVSGLTNLTRLTLWGNNVSDISAVAGLTQLTRLALWGNNISDISAVARLTRLTSLHLGRNNVSDISAVAGLTKLTDLSVHNNSVSNISAVSGLTQLTSLEIGRNNVSDISAVAGLINLTYLDLGGNSVSNISAVSGLTNLTSLTLWGNNVSDISAVAGLTQLTSLTLWGNNISDISAVARLTRLTQLHLSNNAISDVSPLLGLNLTGTEWDSTGLYLRGNPLSYPSINTHIPAIQAKGIEVKFDNQAHPALLKISGDNQNGASFVSLPQSFVVEAQDENGSPLTGISVTFTVTKGGGTLSVTNTKTDSNGRAQTTLRLGPNLGANSVQVSATGIEVPATFHAVSDMEAPPTIADVNNDGSVNVLDLILIASNIGQSGQNSADVNGDRVVSILDLVLAAGMFDATAAAPSAQPQVPETLTAVEVHGWLTDARSLEAKDSIMRRGFLVLEQLLVSLTPTETQLLANYPNPFNPETWIPYRLAEAAFVTLTIYDLSGQVVRTLEVGHRTAAAYENQSKAIYWDGRNQLGESVASGLYFYTLTAGEFSATRRMLILK